MEANKGNNPNGYWTNERHVHFLNNMEASFVRTMIENNGRVVRLDRYLPDSSESTVDLQKERRRRHSTSEIQRNDRRARRPSSEPYTSSQDQVVPQLGNGNVPNTSVSPTN